jgi:hypothetical protein
MRLRCLYQNCQMSTIDEGMTNFEITVGNNAIPQFSLSHQSLFSNFRLNALLSLRRSLTV